MYSDWPVLEHALVNDQPLFEFSPAESLINFEIPALDSSDDLQISDLFNCDYFGENGVCDLNKDDLYFPDGSMFDIEQPDFEKSILDEYLLEALNSDISNDSPSTQSSPDSSLRSSTESLFALQTHDYIAQQENWSEKPCAPVRNEVKMQSWGEPKFCPELNAFKCPVEDCSKLYAKASHVRAHLRRHSGEKPYCCTWNGCSWRFARSDELARHRRSHSGDKPYPCSECSKKFARSDHLAKHGRVHARRAAAAAAAARRSAAAAHTHRRSTRGILLI